MLDVAIHDSLSHVHAIAAFEKKRQHLAPQWRQTAATRRPASRDQPKPHDGRLPMLESVTRVAGEGSVATSSRENCDDSIAFVSFAFRRAVEPGSCCALAGGASLRTCRKARRVVTGRRRRGAADAVGFEYEENSHTDDEGKEAREKTGAAAARSVGRPVETPAGFLHRQRGRRRTARHRAGLSAPRR